MRRSAGELAALVAVAAALTVAVAMPVLRAPSERVFGMDIVGRHHDPFTVMAQFAHPFSAGVYSQPLTDVTGAMLARVMSPVAAYNALVLLSFPLAAAAAFLLARHLGLSPVAGGVAALAYAFAPFHFAQAAYHPHVAQTQWIPLYLLALWRCLDRPSPLRLGLLAAATMTVTLSNDYGGLIAAAITPMAVIAYWLATRRRAPHSLRRLGLTVGALALIMTMGLAVVSWAAPQLITGRWTLAFSRHDLFRYSASWRSYIVPPVEHPLLGGLARRVWTASGVREGLLEQQLYLGWALLVLAIVATSARKTAEPAGTTPSPVSTGFPRTETFVGLLIAVAAVALVCSMPPELRLGGVTVLRPSGMLYNIVPMFRAYARFGVVVQLMAALLAGIGVDVLRRGSRRARVASLALVGLMAAEYVVAPSAMSRDVLPTPAHRWIMRQPEPVRAFDCTVADAASASMSWLTAGRVTAASRANSCAEPHAADALAAAGFTHLIIRRDSPDAAWSVSALERGGLDRVASFDDTAVFALTPPPAIYTEAQTAFAPREHDRLWSWRWMSAGAGWTVVNSGAQSAVVVLGIQLSAFYTPRRLELRLDGRAVQTLTVATERRIYDIGPLTLDPGRHELAFHALDAPTIAGDVMGGGDRRALSFAVGTWQWTTPGGQ